MQLPSHKGFSYDALSTLVIRNANLSAGTSTALYQLWLDALSHCYNNPLVSAEIKAGLPR